MMTVEGTRGEGVGVGSGRVREGAQRAQRGQDQRVRLSLQQGVTSREDREGSGREVGTGPGRHRTAAQGHTGVREAQVGAPARLGATCPGG